MAYSRNPTWQDYPSTATPITAAKLENIESGLESASAAVDLKVNIADAVSLSSTAGSPATTSGYAGTANTAARGDHSHPMQAGPPYALYGTSDHVWANPVGNRGGAGALDNTKCPLSPFPVPRRMTLNELFVRPFTNADGGNAKFAVYAVAANGLPTGAPIWTSSAFAAAGGGNKGLTGLSQTFEPGMYFLACGNYGFTTQRMVLEAPQYLFAAAWVPGIAVTSGQADVKPGLYATGFNDSTGAFPTLTASYSEFTAGPANPSVFWYAIKAIPA